MIKVDKLLVIEGKNLVVTKLLEDEIQIEGSIKKILGMAKDKKIPTVKTDRRKLDEISETKSHQGVIALVSAHNYSTVEEILAFAEEKGEKPFILVLDDIEDPHNLGSIIRTAETAGIHGVIIPKRRAASVNATVSKSSASFRLNL